jgi:hypothetical protein
MAYLRIVLILKAISISIESVWSFLLACSASVMAASFAWSIVCLYGCDLFQYVWGFGSLG